MINQLAEKKLRFFQREISSTKCNVSRSKTILALELVELEDNFRYKIAKTYKLATVKYASSTDYILALKKLSLRIANCLGFDLTRVLDHDDNQIINIEVEEERESKDKKKSLEILLESNRMLKFYGFYELDNEKIFLLADSREINKQVDYLVMRNYIYDYNFPHTN